jgi:predicted RNA-binding protein YlxR (DUF448 family)
VGVVEEDFQLLDFSPVGWPWNLPLEAHTRQRRCDKSRLMDQPPHWLVVFDEKLPPIDSSPHALHRGFWVQSDQSECWGAISKKLGRHLLLRNATLTANSSQRLGWIVLDSKDL